MQGAPGDGLTWRCLMLAPETHPFFLSFFLDVPPGQPDQVPSRFLGSGHLCAKSASGTHPPLPIFQGLDHMLYPSLLIYISSYFYALVCKDGLGGGPYGRV
jgi:hypothetical protein